MSKKYLRKNEFRLDLNEKHFNSNKGPHPAYITARQGHRYKANTITHSKNIKGVYSLAINNPNFNKKDKRQTYLSPPFWQSDKLFTNYTLKNFRVTKETKKKIKKYNKKFQ